MTRREVDLRLATLGDAHDRAAAELYTVDTGSAYQLLRSSTVSGSTLQLWQRMRPRLDLAWALLAALRELLDRARALRAARMRPDLDHLTVLLRDAVVPLDADGMPAAPVPAAPPADRISADA